MNKKILLLSWSDNKGGAAQSCYEIYKCLKFKNKNTRLLVQDKVLKDDSIITYKKLTINLIFRKLFNFFFYFLRNKKNDYSLNLINSDILNLTKIDDYEIVNVHWIGQETLSIKDLGSIKNKLVLTLHDMWLFSGMEHYIDPLPSKFFFHSKVSEYNFLSAFIWKLKKKYWKNFFYIIVPSKWLYNLVKKSKLMKNYPVTVIPYPVNQKIFKNFNKEKKDENILKILYVSSGRLFDQRKGFDLLENSIIKYYKDSYIVFIVGKIKKADLKKIKVKFHSFGYIKSKKKLAKIYNNMDLLALPSRQDNLPNVGLEAHSCGLPILGFKTGGIPEIVKHKNTGFLAEKFDLLKFSKGLHYIKKNKKYLAKNAESRSKKLWNPEVISLQYLKFFKILDNEKKNS